MYVVLLFNAYHMIIANLNSPFILMRHAVEMKKEVMGDVSPLSVGSFGRPVFWDLRPVSLIVMKEF